MLLFLLIILFQFPLNESNVGYFIGTDSSGTLTAGEVCNNAGGRLAIITDSESFTEASSVASSSGYLWAVVALHCTSKDTSCSESASKWIWYDSQNNNDDLCDISTGSLDTLSYYQTWDQWNKIPDGNEHCVEFYGGKLVLEQCNNANIDEILIVSDNAALCQPLSYSLSECTASTDIGYFIGTDSSGTLTAGEVCNNAGGRLAIITDSDAFTEASSVISLSGYKWVVVALHCTSRDTSCSESASKWTWYDSQNNNDDLCDISTGGLDTLSYYQTWDQWDKIPDENEYCVEFYGGKLVLEYCSDPGGIIIDSDTSLPNAALCQSLSRSISDCTNSVSTINEDVANADAGSGTLGVVLIGVVALVIIGAVIGCIFFIKRRQKYGNNATSKASDTGNPGSTTNNIPVATMNNTAPIVQQQHVVIQQQQQQQQPQIVMIQQPNGQFVQAMAGMNNQEIPGQNPSAPPIEVEVVRNDVTMTAETSNPNVSDHNVEKNDVRNWLENSVGFPQYLDNFMLNGYDSLKIIMDINDKTELDDIGIALKGHQNRIIKQIEALRNDRCDTHHDDTPNQYNNNSIEDEGRVTMQ